MKLIISSDWHVDASTAGFERAADVEAAVDETVRAAIESAADFYLFLGDLADFGGARVHRAVELAMRTAVRLHEGGIASRWLVGNHDTGEDGYGTTTLGAVREVAGAGLPVKVWESPEVEVFDRFAFVALPYVARSHAYDPARFVRANPLPDVEHVLVLGHLNLEGIEPGSETTEMPRGRDVFWPLDAIAETYGSRALLVGGHYHRRQVYRGVQIVGSLERLTFGEASNDPGYLWVEA